PPAGSLIAPPPRRTAGSPPPSPAPHTPPLAPSPPAPATPSDPASRSPSTATCPSPHTPQAPCTPVTALQDAVADPEHQPAWTARCTRPGAGRLPRPCGPSPRPARSRAHWPGLPQSHPARYETLGFSPAGRPAHGTPNCRPAPTPPDLRSD